MMTLLDKAHILLQHGPRYSPVWVTSMASDKLPPEVSDLKQLLYFVLDFSFGQVWLSCSLLKI